MLNIYMFFFFINGCKIDKSVGGSIFLFLSCILNQLSDALKLCADFHDQQQMSLCDRHTEVFTSHFLQVQVKSQVFELESKSSLKSLANTKSNSNSDLRAVKSFILIS